MKRIAMILALVSLPVAVFAADAAAGATVYNTKCKMCHGAGATGGVMDKAAIAGTPEATTKATVQNGKGKMKAIASVTGADLDNVAAYIASLKK